MYKATVYCVVSVTIISLSISGWMFMYGLYMCLINSLLVHCYNVSVVNGTSYMIISLDFTFNSNTVWHMDVYTSI